MYETLSKRLAHAKIYTYISSVIISVNPCELSLSPILLSRGLLLIFARHADKQLPQLYGADVIQKYTGAGYFQNEPHIYSLAEGVPVSLGGLCCRLCLQPLLKRIVLRSHPRSSVSLTLHFC